jgi:glucose/arabinose dehydrogenase
MIHRLNTIVMIVLVCAFGALLNAHAQVPEPGNRPNIHQMEVHVYNPVKTEPTDELLAQLHLPEGFEIRKFAEDLQNPRIMAIRSDGTVYVTRRDVGDVLMLRDSNGDGVADVRQTVARRPHMHGIVLDEPNSRVYLATVNAVYVAEMNNDGNFGELEMIIGDLPDGGQHPNRTLGIGPDGKLYISIGSTCNACEETNPEHAAILRAEPDGTRRTVFAHGLRNTLGFDWHPVSGGMWGFDHNTDWLGNDVSHEELNLIEEGSHYGWPYMFDKGIRMPHREPPGEVTWEQWEAMSTDPHLLYTPHGSGMQFQFYKGEMFPSEYRNDAFVTMRGSWNRNPPVGYEVVRVRFDNQGMPQEIEPFITGFLFDTPEGYAHMGRLVGLAMNPADGSLLFCDDTLGVMYRVTYNNQAISAKGHE